MLNANNGERIVMRIELTAPAAEAATGADEEYERRKNFNNNSFVYCGIGKTLLANMLCANHGKNWIDKAVTKKNILHIMQKSIMRRKDYYFCCWVRSFTAL